MAFALYSFLQSQRCQSELNVNGFLFWHAMWHLYPLTCCIMVPFDVLVLGDFTPRWIKRQTRERSQSVITDCSRTKKKESTEVHPKLLSTTVMEMAGVISAVSR